MDAGSATILVEILLIGMIKAAPPVLDIGVQATCNMACPLDGYPCICRDDGIYCQERNLTSIPSLQGCATMIFLQSNKIKEIGTSDFSAIRSVVIIDLADNRISELRAGIFDSLTDLRALILHRNQITTVSEEVFKKLTKLTALDLSHNQITILQTQIFDSNTLLSQLSVYHNNISKLDIRWFQNKSSWTYIHLSQNPWECTCDLWNCYQYLTRNYATEMRCNDAYNGMTESMCIICQTPSFYKGVNMWEIHEFNDSSCKSSGTNTESNIPEPQNGDSHRPTTTTYVKVNRWTYVLIGAICLLLMGILAIVISAGLKKKEKTRKLSMQEHEKERGGQKPF